MRMSRRLALYAVGRGINVKYVSRTSTFTDIYSSFTTQAGNFAIYGSNTYESSNATYLAYNASLTRSTFSSTQQSHRGYGGRIPNSYGFNVKGDVTTNSKGGWSVTGIAEAISPSLTTTALSSVNSGTGTATVKTDFNNCFVVGGGINSTTGPGICYYNTSLTRAALTSLDDKYRVGSANSNLLICLPNGGTSLILYNTSWTQSTISTSTLNYGYIGSNHMFDKYAVFLRGSSSNLNSAISIVNTSGTLSTIDVSSVLHISTSRSETRRLNKNFVGIFNLLDAERGNVTTAWGTLSSSLTFSLDCPQTFADATFLYPEVIESSKTILGLTYPTSIAKYTY